jgi:hypothetical protein
VNTAYPILVVLGAAVVGALRLGFYLSVATVKGGSAAKPYHRWFLGLRREAKLPHQRDILI